MPTLKKKGIPIGAAPPKRPKEFSKRGPELGSRLHPLHSVVTVISNKMGAPYPNLVEHPMFEAILRCLEESRHTFEAKKQWLRDKFGLVQANADADGVGRLQEKAGDLGNILVYEDERVEGRWKGAWRVGCTLEGNKSTFYFRFWDKGMPEALGEDTMLDAVRQFQEQFKPDGIYQLGSNYKIDVDWEKAVAISTYPVKRFSQPKP